MKRLFLFLTLSILILGSCNSDRPKDGSGGKYLVDAQNSTNRGEPAMTEEQKLALAIEEHINAEIKKGKVYKEALPGYNFGMSEKNITKKTKKLARKGDAEKYRKAKKRTYAYAYLMPIFNDELPAFIDFQYNKEGKMFKGEGVMDIPKGSSSMDVLNLTSDLFKEWFGEPSFDLPKYNYCARYIWVDGNRLVDLRCEVDGVAFSFYNLLEETPDLFAVTSPAEDKYDQNRPLLEENPDKDEEQTLQTQ